MSLWKFKIDGWDEEIGGYVHEGLIDGENFTEAVDNLENYYGNEINSLCIEPVDCPYFLSQQHEIN